jgi:hypothetical protein
MCRVFLRPVWWDWYLIVEMEVFGVVDFDVAVYVARVKEDEIGPIYTGVLINFLSDLSGKFVNVETQLLFE